MSLNEKAFLAIANALVINSILFFGEFAQVFTGMRELDFNFNLLTFKNLVLVWYRLLIFLALGTLFRRIHLPSGDHQHLP